MKQGMKGFTRITLPPLCRRMILPLRHRNPDFLIIGAQKAGTSSLYRYLSQHPLMDLPARKEMHYFDRNYQRGRGWYLSQFPLRRRDALSGEATPYYLFHPLAPQRCHSLSSGIRLIVLLRDPVARAYSHYHHEVENGRESREFRQALTEDASRVEEADRQLAEGATQYSYAHQRYSYLARGRYIEQLDRWSKYFPAKQIFRETAERFFADPQAVCTEVFRFLDLEPVSVITGRRHNVGTYEPMSAADREWLADYFEPYNRQLAERYGVDITEWTHN